MEHARESFAQTSMPDMVPDANELERVARIRSLELAVAELATAVSELARNVLVHGGGGEMELAVRRDDAA